MPKYVVRSALFTLGKPGDVVDLDDVPGLNVRALLKSGAVVPVVDKPKRKKVGDEPDNTIEEGDI